jgi:hypothetical protein
MTTQGHVRCLIRATLVLVHCETQRTPTKTKHSLPLACGPKVRPRRPNLNRKLVIIVELLHAARAILTGYYWNEGDVYVRISGFWMSKDGKTRGPGLTIDTPGTEVRASIFSTSIPSGRWAWILRANLSDWPLQIPGPFLKGAPAPSRTMP